MNQLQQYHKAQYQMNFVFNNKKVRVVFIIIILSFSSNSSTESSSLDVYNLGVKFSLAVKWWGLSAQGDMEVIGKENVRGQDTVIVRSHVTEVKGFLSFIIKFLRMYRESNTFDSYINPTSALPVRYEVYKIMQDGSKKPTENVYFDRKNKRVASFDDDSTIVSNTPPDIQDTFSSFLMLINKFNNEDLYVDKCTTLNLYVYWESSKINVRVVGQKVVDGHKVYMMKIDRLPPIFKYPASISFEVVELGDIKFPVRGQCIIELPNFKDIVIDGELSILSRGKKP